MGELIFPKQNDWNEVVRLHSLMRASIAKNCGEPVIDVVYAGPVVKYNETKKLDH